MNGDYYYLSMYYPYWEPLPAQINVSLEKRPMQVDVVERRAMVNMAKRKTKLEVGD
jgi:hypothetical protein